MERGRLGEIGRAELWRRWGAGETLSDMSRVLGCSVATVAYERRQRGGFAPAPRRRAARQLRVGEREEVSRGLASACSLRQIARRLGRAPSTGSRGGGRHGGGGERRGGG